MTPEEAENYAWLLDIVIPPVMAEAQRWLVWRSVPHPDPMKKPRKVPFYSSGQPRGATDTPEDAGQLVTLGVAVAALRANPAPWAGLGFALGADGGGGWWQGIDLDDLPGHPELADLASRLPGYVERSPSGDGLHAIGYGGPFDSLASNSSGIEAYSKARFFTITGRAHHG